MKRLLVVAAALMLLVIVGISAIEIEHQRLRLPPAELADPACSEPREGDPAPAFERLCPGDNAFVTYAELDDQGLFWDELYLERLREFLDLRRRESELVIIMLVHGWNHSADPADSNVACLKEILKVVDRLQRENNYGRQVIGVFVGWRGRKYAIDGVNMALTFWNRMAVADNIGGRGHLRALIEVLRAATRGPGARSRGALILAGHSLGGRALFQATRAQTLAAETDPGADSAELIVLLNPAFTAVDFEEIDRAARLAGANARSDIRLLVAGSREDGVTRHLYPLGERLRGVGKGTNTDRDARLFYQAVGHYPGYFTHELVIENGAYDARAASGASGGCPFVSERQFVVYRQDDPHHLSLYDYRQVEGAAKDAQGRDVPYALRLNPLRAEAGNPVMFVAVDGRIIPDHNNVYTPPFIDFLMRVVNYNVFCGPRCKQRLDQN